MAQHNHIVPGSPDSQGHASMPTRRAFLAGAAVGTLGLLGLGAGCSKESPQGEDVAQEVTKAGDVAAPSGQINPVEEIKAGAKELVATLKSMKAYLTELDFAGAVREGRLVVQQGTQLYGTIDSPLVNLAGVMTEYGYDIEAAKALLIILVDLMNTCVLPLATTLEEHPIDTLFFRSDGSDGFAPGTIRIDIDSIQTMADALIVAMPRIKHASQLIQSIEGLHIGELQEAVNTIRSYLDEYSGFLDTAYILLPVLMPMLGAAGSRTYMIVAQENSEICSCGGFPGAVGFLTFDGGGAWMGNFAGVTKYLPGDPYRPLPITDTERWLYGEAFAYTATTFNKNPDFPRVAQMWQAWCWQENGIFVDGVVALDPVLVRRFVELTGFGVVASNGLLVDGSNAASLLLHDVYLYFPNDPYSQDAFFYETAQQLIELFLSSLSSISVRALANTLKDAIHERHFNLWSLYEEEEEALRQLGWDNGLHYDPAAPKLGIYVSNATWGKIDWFLDMEVTLGDGAEGDAGAEGAGGTEGAVQGLGVGGAPVPVTLRLTNFMTYSDVYASTRYILGSNPKRRQEGDMVTDLYLYAPAGGGIYNMWTAGGDITGFVPRMGELTHNDLWVFLGTVQLLPGESIVFYFDVVPSAEATQPLTVDMTPLCHG